MRFDLKELINGSFADNTQSSLNMKTIPDTLSQISIVRVKN